MLPSGVKVTIEAEDRAIEALIQHIRAQGRAFALFDAARLVLAGEERYQVKFQCEADRLVGLYQVQGVDALFETKEEAMRHLLRSPEALGLYYKVEDVELEEPKGTFTSVAVCGMTGEIFGPASHHSYQLAVKRMHNERFSDMSFDEYKRRIQVKNEPEVIEKWKEQQRKGTKWTWLKGPALEEGQEPASFKTLSEVEAHFRTTHGEASIVEVRNCTVRGTVRREQLSPGLGRLYRRVLEETRKHLFELSQRVAQGLERRGLKLFKRRGGKLYVSRIKPRAVDPGVIFSHRVAALVDRVRNEPGITVAKLIQVDVPADVAATPDLSAPPAPAPEVTAAATDEQMALMRDLRWLADEGYLIEYSDGVVFLGVQGEAAAPKPTGPKPAAKAAVAAVSAEQSAEEPVAEVIADTEEAQAEAPEAKAEAEVAAPEAEVAAPESEVEAPAGEIEAEVEQEQEQEQPVATPGDVVEVAALEPALVAEDESAPEAEVAPEAKEEEAVPVPAAPAPAPADE